MAALMRLPHAHLLQACSSVQPMATSTLWRISCTSYAQGLIQCCHAGLSAAFDGTLAAVAAQAAEHLTRIEQLKEDAATPRTTAGFSLLQSNLQALQTVLGQLMHVNVCPSCLASVSFSSQTMKLLQSSQSSSSACMQDARQPFGISSHGTSMQKQHAQEEHGMRHSGHVAWMPLVQMIACSSLPCFV